MLLLHNTTELSFQYKSDGCVFGFKLNMQIGKTAPETNISPFLNFILCVSHYVCAVHYVCAMLLGTRKGHLKAGTGVCKLPQVC